MALNFIGLDTTDEVKKGWVGAVIRLGQAEDIETILAIWLAASKIAHDFIAPEYWADNVDAMRQHYLPASEVYVAVDDDTQQIQGFVALHGDTLAALFVAPERQGQGIGQALMNKVKSRRQTMTLGVYVRNHRGVAFYERCGFQPLLRQVDADTGAEEWLMQWTQA
ncbi:MAG: GNAT family N-acetyltransferase [Neisseriaceae bacterium]|nr:GNAT family N-acetyltransferase [Neisseriaceae bacterium]MBP6863313.1 GNAT family N-acetyltransferase [Neisseriaceae bacterium]